MHLGTWRKSSYSGGSQATSCVEVATSPDLTGVRDSKNLPGPILTFPTTSWRGFLTRCR